MKSRLHTLYTLLVATVILLTACTDDLDYPRPVATSDSICFDSTVSSQAPAGSKSRSGNAQAPTATAYVMTTEADAASRAAITDDGDGRLFLYAYTYDEFLPIEQPADSTSRQSRANDATGEINNSNMHKKIDVSALLVDQDGTSQTYFENNIVERGSDGIYTFVNGNRFWPPSGTLRFFAYAPKGTHGILDPALSGNTLKVEHITSPEGSWDQEDLVYAVAEQDYSNHNSVPLKFKHACTQIKFVYTDDMPEGRLDVIRIRNIHTKATMTLPVSPTSHDADSPLCTWTLEDEIVKGSDKNMIRRGGGDIVAGKQDFELNGSNYGNFTNWSQVMMAIPQTLTDDAIVEIEFCPRLGNEDCFSPYNVAKIRERIQQRNLKFKAKISGEWKQGTTVVYKLSNSSLGIETNLTVTPDTQEFGYRGGTGAFQVTASTATFTNGLTGDSETKDIPWTVSYLDKDGKEIAPYSWITGIPAKGDANMSDAATVTVGMPQGEGVGFEDLHPHTTWIQENGESFGTSTDLSIDSEGTMTTANCYIVNKAGKYRFPLVYGNAIYKSTDNVDAYTSTKESGKVSVHAPGSSTSTDVQHEVLTPFVNHLGNGISNPRIHKNAGCELNATTPVKILWQDVSGLITDVRLVEGEIKGFRYIEFETALSGNIREGNAVIAAYDTNGSIMWSWHIWVTDYIPFKTASTPTTDYDPTQTNMSDCIITSRYVNSGNGVNEFTQENTLMGVQLGWISDYIRHFFNHEVTVRVTQSKAMLGGAAAFKDVIIKQKEEYVHLDGNAPYYQFGRKDPMCPAQGSRLEVTGTYGQRASKTIYDADGNTIKFDDIKVDGPKTLDFAIKNPLIFINNKAEGDWCSKNYMNLWSANIKDRSDVIISSGTFNNVKTIYDPCPAGYQVPDFYAFTFAIVVANNQWDVWNPNYYKNLNSPNHGERGDNGIGAQEYFYDHLGQLFYCHYKGDSSFGAETYWKPSSGVTFLPALGYRGGTNGDLWCTNPKGDPGPLRGYYWTSTPQLLHITNDSGKTYEYNPQSWGTSISFAHNYVKPQLQNSRAAGFPIRPVREKPKTN